MTYEQIILQMESHERATQILDSIREMKRRINSTISTINGGPGYFPKLRNKYLRTLEIQHSALSRLVTYYNRFLSELIPLPEYSAPVVSTPSLIQS